MKISMITPTLNSAKTVEKTIQSVISQRPADNSFEVEYIIVDGVSTDDTLKIVRSYGGQIDKLVSEKDKGLYDAMNKGVKLATGDVIGIINSDDYLLPDSLQVVADAALKHPQAGVIYGDIIQETPARPPFRVTSVYPKDKTKMHKILYSHASVFVCKWAYEKYGHFDLNYRASADLDLILRLLYDGVPFHNINAALAYTVAGGFASRNDLLALDESTAILLKHNPSLFSWMRIKLNAYRLTTKSHLRKATIMKPIIQAYYAYQNQFAKR